jgi:predicted transcriptional regulator
MQVSEIMTPECQLIDPNSSIRDAVERMRDENIGALPVGIISMADLAQTGDEAEKIALKGVSEPSSEPRR